MEEKPSGTPKAPPKEADPPASRPARHHAEDRQMGAAAFDAFCRRHGIAGDKLMTEAEFDQALAVHLHGRI